MLKSNEYFEGKVKSIALETEKGPATVGVMEKGDYEFSTSSKELMVVVSGSLTVTLKGETQSKTYKEGESFSVEKDSSFKVVADVETAYMCYYN